MLSKNTNFCLDDLMTAMISKMSIRLKNVWHTILGINLSKNPDYTKANESNQIKTPINIDKT